MAQKFLSKGKKKLKAKPKAANKHGRKRSERTLKKGAGRSQGDLAGAAFPAAPRARLSTPLAARTGLTGRRGAGRKVLPPKGGVKKKAYDEDQLLSKFVNSKNEGRTAASVFGQGGRLALVKPSQDAGKQKLTRREKDDAKRLAQANRMKNNGINGLR